MDSQKEYMKQYLPRWYASHPNYIKNYLKEWRANHPNYFREYQNRVKVKVLSYYGRGKCACVRCGESRLACLSIDHINAIGTVQRQKEGFGNSFYRRLVNNNFPKGYQTLCMNCQFVKRVENNETRLGNKK